MPICIVEKNGRSCPIVLCDVCMEIIATAADGNYQWFPHEGRDKTHIPVPVCFTHKRCSNTFERQQSPLHGGRLPSNMELMYFPLYLGNNLEIDQERAERGAKMMAEL